MINERLIKKTFLLVLSILFGLCFNSNYTYWVEVTNSCVRYANSNYNCYEVEPWESYSLKWFELTVSNNLNFIADSYENILLTKFTSSSNKNYTTSLFWNWTWLYHSEWNEWNWGTSIWLLSGVYVSDSSNYTWVVDSLVNQTFHIEPIWNVLETINWTAVDRIVYMLRADFQAYPYFCFIYDSLDYSFCVSNDIHNQQLSDNVWNKYLEKKVGAEIYNSPSELVNYLTTTYWLTESPITVWGGGGSSDWTYIPLDSDVDMVINYYEQRGYRESMCYVWTDNLTATFWDTGISFNEWNWESIFWLYNSIYSWFWNNIIQNVWKFINVRDINYWQWFYCEWENCPRWLAELTWNDVNINLIYTWLTFPFANKPVAIYFMASNLSETYNIDTHWLDVAFYCYSKLNRDSIADWSIDYSDIREKAWSWVLNKVDTYNQYLIDYYTPKWTFQVPTSWEFWDSFWSWGDYSSDNSQSISSSFSDFFTKFTNVFQGYSPAYSVWIIPDWIIFPLIFLILFRIMKH